MGFKLGHICYLEEADHLVLIGYGAKVSPHTCFQYNVDQVLTCSEKPTHGGRMVRSKVQANGAKGSALLP